MHDTRRDTRELGGCCDRGAHVCPERCLIVKIDKLENHAPWDVVLSFHYLSLSTTVGLNRHNKSW